ncbi:MAG: transposase [Acidobacteriaceae bacterium]|nr:transposase [Acidobacteriaceae bacterium]
MSEAVGHLLTFTTYGTHLHGHENGSVNRIHRNWGAPMLEASPTLRNRARCLMRESRFVLDEVDRNAVLDSVRNASTARRWHLYCVHVRTNHVHLVIRPNIAIDRALGYLKARASFALKPFHPERERFWTKHGSARYLWNVEDVTAAMDYVVNRQGIPMSLFVRSPVAALLAPSHTIVQSEP